MSPERKQILSDGRKVEEYYWAGKIVVYIDNQLSQKTFDQVIREAKETDEAILDDAEREMFGEDAEFLPDDMGAK